MLQNKRNLDYGAYSSIRMTQETLQRRKNLSHSVERDGRVLMSTQIDNHPGDIAKETDRNVFGQIVHQGFDHTGLDRLIT